MTLTARDHQARPSPGTAARTAGAGRAPVLVGQVLGSLGLGAAGASGALLITTQTGSDRWAAAPLGAVVLGGALAAWPIARQRSRSRRAGAYAVAFLLAGLGAFVVLTGAAVGAALVIVAGHVLIGAGNTAVMLSRYLVADLVAPGARAQAIGTSFLAISFGAISGPALLGPAAVLAEPMRLPPSSGLYVVSLIVMVAASAVLTATSWAQSDARKPTSTATDRGLPEAPSARPSRPRPSLLAAGASGSVLSMGAANLTMVSLMAVLPLHLSRHGHSLGHVGWAVSAHVAAMFLGSSLFGPLTGRFGARAVAAAGNVMLAGTAATAIVVPIDSMRTGMGLLVALGLGWGAVIVANSTRLATVVEHESRGGLEAASEIAMGLGAVIGCFALAGPLVAAAGVPLLAAVVVPLHLAQLVPELRRTAPSASRDASTVTRKQPVPH
jgi:MFS family permease